MQKYPLEVPINSVEMYLAAQVGTMRYVASRQRGLPEVIHSGQDWDGDCHGAIGELAVAKSLGVYWHPTVNEGKSPDVAGYQVRATNRSPGYLIIRPASVKNEVYIFCTIKFPIVKICGWMWLVDAKVPAFLRKADDKGPEAHWVPQSKLMRTTLPIIGG